MTLRANKLHHQSVGTGRGRGGLSRLLALTLAAGAFVALTPHAAFAADPVAGALTAGDSLFPNQGNGGYDAQHYDISLNTNFTISGTNNAVSTGTVASTTTMTAQTTAAPLSSFGLDFQGSNGNLAASTYDVDSVTVNGVPATFTRTENTTTNNATTDVHKLVVTPATPVDGTFTTVVTAHGAPVIHTDTDGSAEGWANTTDGATFVNQPIGAMTLFPHNDTPRDKATYTFTIEAPTSLRTSNLSQGGNGTAHDVGVVSNGELISKTLNGDGTRATWVWNETKPMASELSLVSIGRYDMYTSNIALASGRTIPEWSFIDPAMSVANQTTTLSTRAQMKSLLDFYESKYGPYPGNSFGLLSDTVPSAINYALETQDRPFFPGSVSRGTFYHETMHQWWGDSVAPTDWNDITLNEGPATYAESQVPYESAGSSPTTTEQSIYSSWNTTSGTSSTFTIPAAAMSQASQLFGSQVYAKGAMTLEALRTAIGAANFETLMRQYQLTYGGGQITGRRTAAFEALAESISGRDLTAFFQSWWFSNTKPAWPFKDNLNVAGPSTATNPGDPANYTVTVRNTGKVAMTAGQAVVTVDLSDVLDDATIGTLPANTTLAGNTLTWSVPATALAATSTIVIPTTVNSGTSNDTLKAVARASSLGSTCVDCSSTTIVIGALPTNPAATPTITGGTPTVGVPLSVNNGTWPDGTTFTYQWLVDGTPVPGATSSTYTPDGSVVGLPVTVEVTGVLGAFNPVVRVSAPTANGVQGTLASVTPTISGSLQAGSPLTVDPGAWTPGTYFTYQWLANNANITGATGPVYTPTNAQNGMPISVAVTGTKFGYTTASKTSAATAAFVAGPALVNTPTPTLSGTPRIGVAYQPTYGAWDDGTVLTFQWAANGANIANATGATYSPTAAVAGRTLTVTVTGTKPGGPPTTKTSAASAAVILTPPTNVVARAGDKHVLIAWTAPVGGPAPTSYSITETQGDAVGMVISSAAGTTSKDITGLANGVSYAFTVQAVNVSGTGANAVTVSSPAVASSTVSPRVVAGEYVGLDPVRILDTRNPLGRTDGDPVDAGRSNAVTLPVLGRGGIPAAGVTAVVLNLTGVNASQSTYVSAVTNLDRGISTSNLNFNDAAPKAVQVTVPVASDGTITLFNAAGTIDLIADVQGYYQDGTGFTAGRVHPQTPQRLLDTRSGLGTPSGTPGRVGDGQFIDVQVTGNAGVPAGATAVVMNLTGVAPTQATYLRAYSPTTPIPATSSVNLGADDVVANLVTAPLSADGKVRLFNASGTINIIADVVGYIGSATDTTGVRYQPITPTRVLDTRDAGVKVGDGQTVETAVNAPAGATGVVVGVTSVYPSRATYLTVGPAGAVTYTSTLNAGAGTVISNAAMSSLGTDSQVSNGIGVLNAQGTNDVLVDVQGYLIP